MKSDFRKKCLDIRKGLLTVNLNEKIKNLPEYKLAKTVFIYISYKNEIETLALLEDALREKTVLVPYCVDDKGTMIACKLSSIEDLKKGMYGILEPANPEEFTGKIDFGIIPGVAFSCDGARLGYGKGYYDRFLSNNNMFMVGLCHDELLFGDIPSDEFDIKMDMVITDKKEIRL